MLTTVDSPVTWTTPPDPATAIASASWVPSPAWSAAASGVVPPSVPARSLLTVQTELLVRVGAVERHCVGSAAAADDVAAVAGVPHERIASSAEVDHVGASLAVDDVVVAAADQVLAAGAAGDGVVARPAVDPRWRRRREGAVPVIDPDHVVTGVSVNLDPVKAVTRDLEVRSSVVSDIDLERLGSPGAKPQSDQRRRRESPRPQACGG
jgi:hypothetical protein